MGKADNEFFEEEIRKFLSPDGQLQIRCRFRIKTAQDFWTNHQYEGSRVAEDLAKEWNSGDFTDSILVTLQNLNSRHIQVADSGVSAI